METMKPYQLIVLAIIIVPAALLLFAESEDLLLLFLSKVAAFGLLAVARFVVRRWKL